MICVTLPCRGLGAKFNTQVSPYSCTDNCPSMAKLQTTHCFPRRTFCPRAATEVPANLFVGDRQSVVGAVGAELALQFSRHKNRPSGRNKGCTGRPWLARVITAIQKRDDRFARPVYAALQKFAMRD